MWFRRRRTENIKEAEQALEDAQQSIQEMKKRGGEVRRVAGALREIGENNHFGDQLEQMFIQRRRRLG